MSAKLELDQQVLPMLGQIESDPGRHSAEFPTVIGRILQGAPDRSTLRHLRGELDAAAGRLHGEHGVPQGGRAAAVTAGVVSGLACVVAGWMEQAEAAENDDAAAGTSFRSLILAALSEGPARPSELADGLSRSRPQVSEALSRLAERGLVMSAESAVDGRSRLYELTDAGRAAADEAIHRLRG